MILTKNKTSSQYKSFCVKTIGSSHIANGTPCEDYALAYDGENCSIIVVCDGHGGKDYVRSRFGSEFAAKAAKNCLVDFVSKIDTKKIKAGTLKERDDIFRQLEASIIAAWNDKVAEHFNGHPFTEEELLNVSDKARNQYQEGSIQSAYGTTLLAVTMTKEYWFALQIGDCRCVVLNNEHFSEPVPWNDKCVFNETTSICDSDAIHEFTNCYSEEIPEAIFIASDGVEDSFATEEKMCAFYKLIYQSFTDSEKTWDNALKELQDYIPKLSLQGSHDDVSIAGLVKVNEATPSVVEENKTKTTHIKFSWSVEIFKKLFSK